MLKYLMVYKKREKEFIFQSLFDKKRELPFLSEEEQEKIYITISEFFLSGFVLENACLKQQYPTLYHKLFALNQNLLMRKLLMLNDLTVIEKEFNKRNIGYILLKGASIDRIKLHTANQRHFRDIDILVKDIDLIRAVEALTSLGFRNEKKYSLTRIKYIPQSHQIPVMINKNRTQIDLHFRITRPDIYKKCPLTEKFFKNHNTDNKTPDLDSLVSHSIYHAFQHHEQNQGPLFIFDILGLIGASKKAEVELTIPKELNLSDQYSALTKLETYTNRKEFLDAPSYSLLKELSKDFNWSKSPQNKFVVFSKTRDINEKNINTKIIFKKLNNIKYAYQVDYFSFRFVLILFKEMFNLLKRIRL